MSQARLKAAITKYTTLVSLGCKKYILNLLDAEEQLETLKKKQNMEPTHQELWNSIQNGEWVQKSKVVYDQDWDDEGSVIETRVTWYEHPVWGTRENLGCEAPDARSERERLSAIADSRQELFLSEVERIKQIKSVPYDREQFLKVSDFWGQNQNWIEFQCAKNEITEENIKQLASAYCLYKEWNPIWVKLKNQELDKVLKASQEQYQREKNDPTKYFTAYMADRKAKNLPRLSWDKWVKLVQVK